MKKEEPEKSMLADPALLDKFDKLLIDLLGAWHTESIDALESICYSKVMQEVHELMEVTGN
ncbi:hypothetical protein BDV36DRAFT_300909 [Aspergillus pseudocaelatus]|uniref:Uncharacterized protein n=1 Tax=Aspergillus pseudocaelatus TaxID=1825620 RepID=A0ABQ6W5M2_9EURO|nr:hypothetical protein BDV36DRAFT_300909 [Aspergillus pseudocaelatus]